MAKQGGYQGSHEAAIIPVEAGDRGDLGGKVCRDEVFWNFGNSSLMFRLRIARSSQGWSRLPGAQTGKIGC
jgi:hypothetical protein